MAYTEQKGRELVVEAGLKLFESKLVTRTWGNISARVSDTQFVITPSGRPYDTITPDQIVLANLSDWSYEGDIIPSDEIGVHANIYNLHPEVNFVIHTHQRKAGIIASTQLEYIPVPEKYKDILGEVVPCSGYGLPKTKKLCRQVKAAAEKYSQSNAVIMRHHGTACFGKTMEETFEVALTLEEVCRLTIENNFLNKSDSIIFNKHEMETFYLNQMNESLEMPTIITDLGTSVRKGSSFELSMKDGSVYTVPVDLEDTANAFPEIAKIHSNIYKGFSDINYISHLCDSYTVTLSTLAQPMRSYLDDFAQILGTVIKVSEWNENSSSESAQNIANKLKGNNVVLIKNGGAICTAKNELDMSAVSAVMSKGCEAQIGVKLFESGKEIPWLDRFIMRQFFTRKYSKQADNL